MVVVPAVQVAGELEYTALRDIEAGEEILINDNGAPDDLKPPCSTSSEPA